MSHTVVVTRDQFMDLIESGITDTLSGSDKAKLRAFGVSGVEAAVGSYCRGCPINKVFGVTGDEESLRPGYEDFAYGFDDAVRDLLASDPGKDVPPHGLVEKVVVK